MLAKQSHKNHPHSKLCRELHMSTYVRAPTLAEKLRLDGAIKCLLLDFDSRLGQFFVEGRREEWCWYNMFNHHFFGGDKSRQ